MKITTLTIAAGLAIGAIGLTGCATKTYVEDRVNTASRDSDTKIGEVQKQVEATQSDVTNLKKSDSEQNVRLTQVSDTARDALQRAQEAGKLAKGKFLYEVVLTDESIHFALDSSELSADAKAALSAFAKKLKSDNVNVYIEIQGFTDKTGAAEYNKKLSKERAEAVLQYLNMEEGLPLHRMNSVGYGAAKPIADNANKDGRAKNRRVALVVLT